MIAATETRPLCATFRCARRGVPAEADGYCWKCLDARADRAAEATEARADAAREKGLNF